MKGTLRFGRKLEKKKNGWACDHGTANGPFIGLGKNGWVQREVFFFFLGVA